MSGLQCGLSSGYLVTQVTSKFSDQWANQRWTEHEFLERWKEEFLWLVSMKMLSQCTKMKCTMKMLSQCTKIGIERGHVQWEHLNKWGQWTATQDVEDLCLKLSVGSCLGNDQKAERHCHKDAFAIFRGKVGGITGRLPICKTGEDPIFPGLNLLVCFILVVSKWIQKAEEITDA